MAVSEAGGGELASHRSLRAVPDGRRLSATALLPAAAQPHAQPSSAGIVHIGLGAFHRAHQAVFTEDAIAAGGGDWGIIAVAPRSATVVAQLREQDHRFSVTSRAPDRDTARVIGSVIGTRHLPTEGDEVLALLADPAIQVVTLTVTEKAYVGPSTVVDLLVSGVRRRAAAGGPPLAIVSCDNLPGNGARVRGLVEAALGEPPGDWLSFPATMVDRIVPASTPATLARARALLGVTDLAAVEAEPASYWVIEDRFAAGRPAWEAAGAILTDDVTPWERLKLRVLNGLHSTTAYLGALAGCATIADALTLPGLAELLRELALVDIAPTLTPPSGVSIEAYVDSTLDRFANPAIAHRTLQIAMDGSQKLPQRLLHTIVDRRAQGHGPGLTALAVAAWMRFVGGVADGGQPLPLDDPLASAIQPARPASDDPHRIVTALLGLDAVFPPSLRADTEFAEAVAEWLTALTLDGAAATVRLARAST